MLTLSTGNVPYYTAHTIGNRGHNGNLVRSTHYHLGELVSYTHRFGKKINRLYGDGISLTSHSFNPPLFNGLQKWGHISTVQVMNFFRQLKKVFLAIHILKFGVELFTLDQNCIAFRCGKPVF